MSVDLLAVENDVGRYRKNPNRTRIGFAYRAATKHIPALLDEVKRLREFEWIDKTLFAQTVEERDKAEAEVERLRAERDEARATKDMHKERQEEYLLRAEKAESELWPVVAMRNRALNERDAARAALARLDDRDGVIAVLALVDSKVNVPKSGIYGRYADAVIAHVRGEGS